MKKIGGTVFVFLALVSFASAQAQVFDQGIYSCHDFPDQYDFSSEGGSLFGLYEAGGNGIDIRLLANVDLDLLEQEINALLPPGVGKNIFHKIGKFFNDLGDLVDDFIDLFDDIFSFSTPVGGTANGQSMGAAVNSLLGAADYYVSRTLVDNGVKLDDARNVIISLQGTRAE